jgi:septal ring factor EnvC (AmiA/AmiB activator)
MSTELISKIKTIIQNNGNIDSVIDYIVYYLEISYEIKTKIQVLESENKMLKMSKDEMKKDKDELIERLNEQIKEKDIKINDLEKDKYNILNDFSLKILQLKVTEH